MQITYQLTEHDFSGAYRTHRDSKKLVKWALRFFVVFVGSMAVLTVYFAITDPTQRTATTTLAMPGLLIFWTLSLWILPRWGMMRQFRNQPGAQGPRTVTFDADGVHWRWEGGSGDVAWKNYIRWAESKDQILLYTSPACFNIVPSRALQPAELAELRELLKQNIQC